MALSERDNRIAAAIGMALPSALFGYIIAGTWGLAIGAALGALYGYTDDELVQ